MAIDPVRKVWLVCPASHAPDVPEQVAAIGLMHVAEVPLGHDGRPDAIASLSADTRDIESHIRRLTETLDVLGEFAKTSRDFLANLIPTPVETTREELDAALETIDIDALHQKAKALAARRAEAQTALEKARERLATIAAFRTVDVTVPSQASMRWTQATLWLVPAKQAVRVLDGGLAPDGATLQQLGLVGSKALVASVALRDDADNVSARLRGMGFEAVPGPDQPVTLVAYVKAIEAQRDQAEKTLAETLAELAETSKLRHQAELVLGHWEEKLATARALDKMITTGRAAVLTGYVRVREFDPFAAALAERLPQVSMVAQEPSTDDDVPVSLTNKPVFRPAQFLVEMFGLPGYFKFDPSAYLMVSFVLFFGICLGDVIYGLVVLGMTLPLVKKYRAYPGLRNFFTLLAVCGVSSSLFGVLTGTWAADIWKPDYLGEGNVFAALVTALQVADPLDKPLIALGIALTLGVLNQFWGIVMRMKGCWLQGDKLGALFDGGLWFLMLPGLVMLIAWFFAAPPKPGWLLTTGAALAIAGSVGLAVTQGRGEKSLVGKIAVGIVSLYGIVGSYGAVTFIGDTLSYSRLLALGLTTAIVGMAVNIICGMLGGIPFIGIVLFILIAVFGHFFNLLISGLGAFIHSARLIFVEFFGRFYEPGAQRFAPLGATSGRIRVVD